LGGTRATEQGLRPKRIGVAFNATAEMALRYYTAPEKKNTADEV
jgi:hypothetical protein